MGGQALRSRHFEAYPAVGARANVIKKKIRTMKRPKETNILNRWRLFLSMWRYSHRPIMNATAAIAATTLREICRRSAVPPAGDCRGASLRCRLPAPVAPGAGPLEGSRACAATPGMEDAKATEEALDLRIDRFVMLMIVTMLCVHECHSTFGVCAGSAGPASRCPPPQRAPRARSGWPAPAAAQT